jgi:hypothetical protein
MRHWISFLALVVMGIVAGCSSETAQTGKPGKDTEAASTAAGGPGEGNVAASVVPGSYEDWCDEHGVPESACTRCDASLVPAFQAVGDWDAEHGLPRSQCLKCDPTLEIVRPPQPEGK